MYYELTCGGTEGVNRSYVKATEEEMEVFNRVLKSELHCTWDWGGSLPTVTATFNTIKEMYEHIYCKELNNLKMINISVEDYADIMHYVERNNITDYTYDVNDAIKTYGAEKTRNMYLSFLDVIHGGKNNE